MGVNQCNLHKSEVTRRKHRREIHHIVEMIYALYRAIHQENLHSFFLYVTTRLSILSRLCRHACQCISLEIRNSVDTYSKINAILAEMFAVQMELTPKARHTKLQYILQDVTIQRISRFALHARARVELRPRACRLFSIVNLIIRIHSAD